MAGFLEARPDKDNMAGSLEPRPYFRTMRANPIEDSSSTDATVTMDWIALNGTGAGNSDVITQDDKGDEAGFLEAWPDLKQMFLLIVTFYFSDSIYSLLMSHCYPSLLCQPSLLIRFENDN